VSEKSRLVDAVREMRTLQREYFRARGTATLCRAKLAEARVDRLLQRLDSPQDSLPLGGDDER
jgi:hypothetical protein